MILDVNERLFIKSLIKLLEKQSSSLCTLSEFQKEIDLEESFFLETVLSLERKKAVEVGFRQKNYIIKVKNWHTKYPARSDFYIKITKPALLQI